VDTTTELPISVAPQMQDLGLRDRYARAALITAIGGIVGRIFQGLTPLALARFLGPNQYGIYALVMSVMAVVAGTAPLGQSAALQKFLPEYAAKDPGRGKSILISSILMVGTSVGLIGLLLLIVAPWIAQSVYHDSTLSGKLRFTVLSVIAMSMFNLLSSVVLGLQGVRTYSLAVIVRSVTFLVCGSIGAIMFGVYGAIAGQTVGAGAALGILTLASYRLARARLPGRATSIFRRDVVLEIMSFGVPALLAGFVVAGGMWWANTALARDGGYGQLANFSVAWALMQLILLLPSSLSTPAVSFMSEAYTVRGKQAFGRFVSDNLRLIWAITLPLCFGSALFAEKLVAIGFGSRYAAAAPLARWMSIVALLIAINSQIGLALSSLGKMWQALALNMAWLIVFVPLAAFGAHAGALGVAYAYCLSYLVFTVLLWIYSEKSLGVRYRHLFPLLILSGLVFLLGGWVGSRPMYGVDGWSRFLLIPGLLVLEWTWVLRDAERTRLRLMASRLNVKFWRAEPRAQVEASFSNAIVAQLKD
jgi:lipopolysaccharide exporter